MYNTKQKNKIFTFLQNNPKKTFGIEALIKELNMAKTTLYRNLEALFLSGLVLRFYDDEKNSFLYQYADKRDNCDNHIHLKCKKCGQIIHLDCDEMNQFAKHIKEEHSFNIVFENALLFGICKDCEEK